MPSRKNRQFGGTYQFLLVNNVGVTSLFEILDKRTDETSTLTVEIGKMNIFINVYSFVGIDTRLIRGLDTFDADNLWVRFQNSSK